MSHSKIFIFAVAFCFLLNPAYADFADIVTAATEIKSLPFAEISQLTEDSPVYNGKYVGVYKITLGDSEAVDILLGGTTNFLDTYLYILDESGNLIYDDDDEGNNRPINVDGSQYSANSYILLYGSGTYYILASTYYTYTTGTYAIEVKELNFKDIFAAATEIKNLPFAEVSQLTTDSPIYDDKYVGVYKITLGDGEAVEILLGSAANYLDTYLYILDESGNLIYDDDDGGSSSPINVDGSQYYANSYIGLSSIGTYYILASTYYTYTTGTYAIEVKTIDKPTIETTTLPNGTIDVWYYKELRSTAPSARWSTDGDLPPGLWLDSYDGEIGGYPEEIGSFTFTVTATNSVGSDSKQFTIVIEQPTKPVFATTTLQNGVLDNLYVGVIFLKNSASELNLKAGSNFPKGLSYECWEEGCEIWGSPEQAGNFTFIFVAENSAGSTEQEFSIRIAEDFENPVILTTTLPNGFVDQEYYVAQLVSESSATWTLESGSLPPGLLIYSEFSIIYGYPMQAGTFTFTIKATNSEGSDTKEFSITISADATPVVYAAIPKANTLKAWMQSGTLHLSGLAIGKTWSIYSAKGTLMHQGIASGAEMNVKLNMASGVYFVKSNGQTLRIVKK